MCERAAISVSSAYKNGTDVITGAITPERRDAPVTMVTRLLPQYSGTVKVIKNVTFDARACAE